MVLKVFSVFDAKLASFGRPWYELTEASAIRVFTDAVNDDSNQNNQWFKHPEDFSLFHIGEFNDETGNVEPCLPVSLVTASAIYNHQKTIQMDLFNGKKQKKVEVVQ